MSWLVAVPTVIELLLDEPGVPLPGVRLVVTGGEPVQHRQVRLQGGAGRLGGQVVGSTYSTTM